MRSAPVDYSTQEIESFLPSGWSLAGPPGSWDGKRGAWSVLVRDGAEQEWKLAVKGAEAEKRGRLDALKRAADELYRNALG
jgi:hypothetical protein